MTMPQGGSESENWYTGGFSSLYWMPMTITILFVSETKTCSFMIIIFMFRCIFSQCDLVCHLDLRASLKERNFSSFFTIFLFLLWVSRSPENLLKLNGRAHSFTSKIIFFPNYGHVGGVLSRTVFTIILILRIFLFLEFCSFLRMILRITFLYKIL